MSGESLRSLYLIPKPGMTIRHPLTESIGVLSAGTNPYYKNAQMQQF